SAYPSYLLMCAPPPSLPLFIFVSVLPPHPRSPLFPYTTLFRSKIIGQFSIVIRTPCAVACSTIGGQISSARSQLASTCSERSRSDRKSTRLNSSHVSISYAVFCLKKKKHINGSPVYQKHLHCDD